MAILKQTLIALAAITPLFVPMAAEAALRDTVNHSLEQFASVAHPDAVAPNVMLPASQKVAAPAESSFLPGLPEFHMPALPSIAVAELPEPSIEMPLKKIMCVEYARARSGMAVFGDAKFWWSRAKNLYARMRAPVENSVMVFTATKKLRLGHVAVVTSVISDREIRVDQANWQNHGEIDHSTPIRDVSTKNDWSKVRVWDMKSGQFGAIYPVSGFIAKDLVRQASAD
jgi:hypothetical protein